jgi:hypothetical protein
MMDEAGMMLLVEPVLPNAALIDHETARVVAGIDWSSYGKPPSNPPSTAQEDASRPDWQQRVIDEKAELDERIGKLCAFLKGDAYRALPDVDRHLLDRQLVLHRRECLHVR